MGKKFLLAVKNPSDKGATIFYFKSRIKRQLAKRDFIKKGYNISISDEYRRDNT